MQEDKVTTAENFDEYTMSDKEPLFQIRPGLSHKAAISFAETALEVSKSMMNTIVAGNDNAADTAYAARFLIASAIAAYRSTGARA